MLGVEPYAKDMFASRCFQPLVLGSDHVSIYRLAASMLPVSSATRALIRATRDSIAIIS